MQRKVTREKFRSFLRQNDGYKQVVTQLDEIFAETGDNGHILQSELINLLEGKLNTSALPPVLEAFFALDDEQFATLVTRLAQDLDLAPMRAAYEEVAEMHDIDHPSSTQLLNALIRDTDMKKVADGIGIWLTEPLATPTVPKLGSLAGIVSRMRTMMRILWSDQVATPTVAKLGSLASIVSRVRTIRELWSDQEVTADLRRLFSEINQIATFTQGSEEDVPEGYYTALLSSQLEPLLEALFDNHNTSKVIGDIGFIVAGEEVDLLYVETFLLAAIKIEAKNTTD